LGYVSVPALLLLWWLPNENNSLEVREATQGGLAEVRGSVADIEFPRC
jgi:hypothetical protein